MYYSADYPPYNNDSCPEYRRFESVKFCRFITKAYLYVLYLILKLVSIIFVLIFYDFCVKFQMKCWAERGWTGKRRPIKERSIITIRRVEGIAPAITGQCIWKYRYKKCGQGYGRILRKLITPEIQKN